MGSGSLDVVYLVRNVFASRCIFDFKPGPFSATLGRCRTHRGRCHLCVVVHKNIRDHAVLGRCRQNRGAPWFENARKILNYICHCAAATNIRTFPGGSGPRKDQRTLALLLGILRMIRKKPRNSCVDAQYTTRFPLECGQYSSIQCEVL